MSGVYFPIKDFLFEDIYPTIIQKYNKNKVNHYLHPGFEEEYDYVSNISENSLAFKYENKAMSGLGTKFSTEDRAGTSLQHVI